MRYIVVVLALSAVLIAGCGGGGGTSQPAPAPEQPAAQAPAAGGNVVVVKMGEFKFELSPAEVPAGTVRFQVENTGTVEHSFLIEELGLKTEPLPAGRTVTVTADAKAGTYTAVCDVVGHKEAGMTVPVVVK